MQENLRGLYRGLLTLVPQLWPDSEEETDLYQPFIPPIPAFFNTISALMILRERIKISETTIEIGKGKTRYTMMTVTKEISNQGASFLPLGLLSFALLMDNFGKYNI